MAFYLFIDISESKSYCLFIDMKINRAIYSMMGELNLSHILQFQGFLWQIIVTVILQEKNSIKLYLCI